MGAVQSLGVPWQLTTEYRARGGGMRVRNRGAGTRQAPTPGLKFAKKTRQCRKLAKCFEFWGISRANPVINPTSIEREDQISLINLQSELILLFSLQSYLSFNSFLLFLQNFNLDKVMRNLDFPVKKEFFLTSEIAPGPPITFEILLNGWRYRADLNGISKVFEGPGAIPDVKKNSFFKIHRAGAKKITKNRFDHCLIERKKSGNLKKKLWIQKNEKRAVGKWFKMPLEHRKCPKWIHKPELSSIFFLISLFCELFAIHRWV